MFLRYLRPRTLTGVLFEGENPPDPIKEAQFARDAAVAETAKLKKQLEDIQKQLPNDEQRKKWEQLEAAQAKAEEERKRKEGEFDSWRKDITTKHQTEIEEREKKIAGLSKRFQDTVTYAAFGGASEYFSGADNSKTILDVDLAVSYLGKYVSVEDDEHDPRGYIIVVKKPDGSRILGNDGKPAPFVEAIGKLIEALPNKNRILRGSGKTGSGSSGGGNGTTDKVDYAHLTEEQMRDPKIREEAKRRQAAAGGITMGDAFDRMQAAKK